MRLVVLGDSSAAGDGLAAAELALPRRIAEHVSARSGRPVRVTTTARSGARTADVTEHQVPRLEVTGADLVVVVTGVNDALGRRRPSKVYTDTCRLITAIRRAAPGADVVLLACPDLRHAPALPWALGAIVGIATRLVARAQARAGADLGVPVVRLGRAPDAAEFGPDGFHPGVDGVDAIASELAAVL